MRDRPGGSGLRAGIAAEPADGGPHWSAASTPSMEDRRLPPADAKGCSGTAPVVPAADGDVDGSFHDAPSDDGGQACVFSVVGLWPEDPVGRRGSATGDPGAGLWPLRLLTRPRCRRARALYPPLRAGRVGDGAAREGSLSPPPSACPSPRTPCRGRTVEKGLSGDAPPPGRRPVLPPPPLPLLLGLRRCKGDDGNSSRPGLDMMLAPCRWPLPPRSHGLLERG